MYTTACDVNWSGENKKTNHIHKWNSSQYGRMCSGISLSNKLINNGAFNIEIEINKHFNVFIVLVQIRGSYVIKTSVIC